jgi:hypothetical protein
VTPVTFSSMGRCREYLVGEPTTRLGLPGPVAEPPDLESIAAIARDYGMRSSGGPSQRP